MPTLAQILEVLDRDEALEVGAAPDIWPTLDPDDAVYELDWSRLFPGRVLDRGQADWDLYGNDEWSLPPETLQQFDDRTPSGVDRSPPGWDRCAWYQPIHFHGPAWGIFLYDQCVIDVARLLYSALGGPRLTDSLAKTLLRAGFAALFLHEQYHHKTESLGLRLHVIQQSAKYVAYFRSVYVPAAGSDDQIEEGLANADSYHRLDDAPYKDWLGKSVKQLTKAYLTASFAVSPPGYRLASGLLDVADFDAMENELEAQVQEATLKPTRPSPEDFGLATHLNQSIFSIRQNIWTVAAKGATPLLPVKPGWVTPLSRSSLEQFLRANGFEAQKGRGKGSHKLYVKAGAPTVVLPASKDLSHVVLRNTAHALGMRNARELLDSVRN
jgi:predicted RNA binding protein YcfA (HicA-like mRNA interferase family)